MSNNHGKFVWYDVMTSDLKGAESFYRSVMGWEMKDSGMPDRTYLLIHAGPIMVGGLMPTPGEMKGMNPVWSGYISVSDVDVYADKVKAAGGAIYRPPTDIPGVGRFAVAADPHGAGFILFKALSDESPAAVAPGTPGHVGWHELHAGKLETAWEFYSGLFGWTKAEAVDMGPMGVYQTFSTGGLPVGGMMTKMPEAPGTFWLYYFNVEAIDAAAERVTGAGGKVIMGPHQVPGDRWIVQCLDPQGAMFALLATKR